jgi:hypothetical protein
MVLVHSVYYYHIFQAAVHIREQSVGIVKCPSYFLSTLDDVTPSIPDRIVIAHHNIKILLRVLYNRNSCFVYS